MRVPSRLVLGLSCFIGGLVLGVTTLSIGAGSFGSDRFPDVPKDSYFDEAVGEMAELGVIRGRPDGRFDPGAFATRADIAVMMKRLRDEILGIEGGSTSSSSSRSSRTTSSSSSISSSTSSSSSTSRSSSSVSRNPNGTVRFTTSNFTVDEDESPAKITLIRTGGAEGVISVEYALTAGTATAVDDYVVSQGTLSFAAEETSRIFTIDIVDDTGVESAETLTITLSDPTGGADISSPNAATLTIKDNDGGGTTSGGSSASTFNFSALNYSMSEALSSITIRVQRTGSTGTASVNYATVDSTAKAGSDYTSTNGTLSFASGETEKSFSISLNNDGNTEGNEKVLIRLTQPNGATIPEGNGEVELTIIDDEVIAFGTGSIKFAEEEYDIDEEEKTITLTVKRTGGAMGTVSVDYETTNGLAKAGEDYTSADSTLVFQAGETEKTITIGILQDDKDDPDEMFSVNLSNVTHGAALGEPKKATITIRQ